MSLSRKDTSIFLKYRLGYFIKTPIAKVISGGQTGADRGGLDAAIELDIPHGGWCPSGRRAEDGAIPACYNLTETSSSDSVIRTEQNVIDSHVTLVFTYGRPEGGSQLTIDLARKYTRPWLHLDLDELDDEKLAKRILVPLKRSGGIQSGDEHLPVFNPVVNVAGSRESKAPGIQERVRKVMLLVLDPPA